jgi:hypothetical protein
MKKTLRALANKKLTMPIFTVATADDESISTKAVFSFFTKQENPLNRLLIYTTNTKVDYKDHRIVLKNSGFSEKKIIDFAHTAIPIAPTNPHYGEQGDFKDFQHYRYDAKKFSKGPIYLGAISKKNLKNYIIQRLSYNPDYDGMMQQIDDFLKNIAAVS